MPQIIQKLANSKDSLRSQSHRTSTALCEKAGGAVVEGGQVDSGAVSVLGCLGAQERKGVGAFMQKPTVKFHTANSQSLAAG